MTITNGYGTLDGYKRRFYDGDVDDRKDDQVLEPVIESVSRLIDAICERRFYAADETRYYTPDDSEYLFVDDLLTVSTLKTDEEADRTYEVTWDTDDYDLKPDNAATDGSPYTYIEISPLGTYVFPTNSRSVELIGSFGYSSTTPAMIAEACYLGAHRIMKRLQTPLGVSAAASLGQLQVQVDRLRSDPDFMAFLAPYRRMV